MAGLIISFWFIYVFTEKKPFANAADSFLGIILSYSIALVFLAALMIKAQVTSDEKDDEDVFGILLVVVLGLGPLATALQVFWVQLTALAKGLTRALMQKIYPPQPPSGSNVEDGAKGFSNTPDVADWAKLKGEDKKSAPLSTRSACLGQEKRTAGKSSKSVASAHLDTKSASSPPEIAVEEGTWSSLETRPVCSSRPGSSRNENASISQHGAAAGEGRPIAKVAKPNISSTPRIGTMF